MDGFSLFTEMQAGMSYRAFPLSKGVPEGRGIQASVSMPAVRFLCSFPLDGKSKIRHKSKEPKDQGRLHRTSPRLSKRLTLRSRSTFCEGKRQAPLREGQPFSHPLRARLVSLSNHPRPAAPPPRPPQSGFGVSAHGVHCSHFRSKRDTPALGVIADKDPQSPKPPEN